MASSGSSTSYRYLFVDFLDHYDYVSIGFINAGHKALEPYVAMAHIIRIISTTATSIELLAKDHTGTAIFALRDQAASQFYEEHLPKHSETNSNDHPFALGDNWFRTCLFKLDWTKTVIVNGQIGHVVTEICMCQEAIDEFADCRLHPEKYKRYTEEIASAVPLATGYVQSDILKSMSHLHI